MGNYLISKTLDEDSNVPAEQRLWRAVLEQALNDVFGTSTIWMGDRDKQDVENFFRTRTKEFDDICDNAGLDPTRLWRKVQRLKGVQAGFLIPHKKETKTIAMFQSFNERRKKYVQSHWRYNVG